VTSGGVGKAGAIILDSTVFSSYRDYMGYIIGRRNVREIFQGFGGNVPFFDSRQQPDAAGAGVRE
jgi:hypothetical protein